MRTVTIDLDTGKVLPNPDDEKKYKALMGRVRRDMVFIRSAEIFGKRSGNHFDIFCGKYRHVGNY